MAIGIVDSSNGGAGAPLTGYMVSKTTPANAAQSWESQRRTLVCIRAQLLSYGLEVGRDEWVREVRQRSSWGGSEGEGESCCRSRVAMG
jgi:hypothetical protein